MKTKKKTVYKIILKLKTPLALVFWLTVWHIARYVFSETMGMDLLIPSLGAVLNEFTVLLKDKEFYISCFNSLYKVLLGWTIGIIAGSILGILTKLSVLLKALFEPMLHLIKATPVASFIVLAIVLMTSKAVPVFTCALITVPAVWANVNEGLSSPDQKLLEMASFFNMSKRKKIADIYIPAVMPFFSAAAKTTMGLAWKAGIAAEVLCTPRYTIGSEISDSKVYLEMPSLFAWTITVIVLSVILEKLIGLVLNGKPKDGKTHSFSLKNLIRGDGK